MTLKWEPVEEIEVGIQPEEAKMGKSMTFRDGRGEYDGFGRQDTVTQKRHALDWARTQLELCEEDLRFEEREMGKSQEEAMGEAGAAVRVSDPLEPFDHDVTGRTQRAESRGLGEEAIEFVEIDEVLPDTEPDEDMPEDPWAHRSEKMRCAGCMWYVPKGTAGMGRCRRHAPTMGGYPVVFKTDWCGDHKLDETVT